jgi:hypothetical protein
MVRSVSQIESDQQIDCEGPATATNFALFFVGSKTSYEVLTHEHFCHAYMISVTLGEDSKYMYMISVTLT